MAGRHLELDAPVLDVDAFQGRSVVLVAPANWTAVIFLATLGSLHLSIAIPAFMHQRWEGYLSLFLGTGFLTASFIASRLRNTVSLEPATREIGIHTGVGRFAFVRRIPFDDVHAVRLISSAADYPPARVEILCDNEDIECPPTTHPRQEALCLAMLLGVQLVKVSSTRVSAVESPEDELDAGRPM